MSITPLPPAPAVTDTTSEFNTKAFNWVAALDTFTTETNAVAEICSDAEVTASAALAAVGAEAWVSGTTYAIGDPVYSPIDLQTYRRKTNGAGTTDPSADSTNWTQVRLDPIAASQAEMETGTEAALRSMSPLRISQAIAAKTVKANVYQATASGSLANGDKVVVNSNGTVSVVSATSINPPTAGSSNVFEAASTNFISCAIDNSTGKIVVVYQDNANSSYGTAVVGYVSGTSIVFGTPVVFNSASTEWCSVSFDSVNNKFVVFYLNATNGQNKTKVGAVSGTNISFGNEGTFTGSAQYISSVFDPTSGKLVVVFRNESNSGRGTAIVCTVSGTSVSFGTAAVFQTTATQFCSVTKDSTNNKIVVAYRNVGNSNYGTAAVGTISGTDISFGTPVVFESAETDQISATFDSLNGKVVIAYRDQGNSSYGTAIVGTVSGTSISFGTAVVFRNNSCNAIAASFDTASNKTIISYKDGGNSGYGTSVAGTVSGTSISFGTSVVFESENIQDTYISSVFDAVNGKTFIAYKDNSNNGEANTVSSVSSNLTLTNFIGISDAAYTNGQTATIQTIGAVDDAQSGLTPGKAYYVSYKGSLTQANTGVLAGTAVSTTKIIVKG